MSEGRLDPVTFEIVSHRLWQVTEDMASTIKNVSGSPVATETDDFGVGLFRPNGDILSAGFHASAQIAAMSQAIQEITRRYSDDPGIAEGDAFLFNDPYLGCLHPNDCEIISPLHYKGELIGWAGSMIHLVDTASIQPFGVNIKATEVFQEGLRFAGIKIVAGERVRKDVFESIVGMTRLPGLVGLDLKAQVAAGVVARRRMGELVERYGIDTVKAIEDELIRYGEARMRARLRELPDGTWRAVAYEEPS